MLLEERRSVLKYVIFNILTLGIYGLINDANIARDTAVACHGDGKKTVFGAKEMLLSVVTLGIYEIIWSAGMIKRLNEFSKEKNLGAYVNPISYIIFRILLVTAPVAMSRVYRVLGRACMHFNDEFFRLDGDDQFTQRAREIVAEALKREEGIAADTVAGVAVVEEYDPTKDRRRLDHTAEEAARAALLAELAEEERKDAERKAQEERAAAEEAEREKERIAKLKHRNNRWFIGAFSVLLSIFLIPLAIMLVSAFALPAVYEDTFVGELGEKYDRLNSIDTPKVVVIGGSSVAFGLDSEMVEEELGMKTVNFGLYANLGTKLMLDLSKSNINKGDIIVIAPEMNSQTLSLYFNAETTLQALDGNWKMLKNIDSDNYEALIGALWAFSSQKLEYTLTGARPQNDGAYKKEWFNDYGDNNYERPYNVMANTQQNIKLDFRTNDFDTKTSEYEQFIEYVNEYVAFCAQRDATVYFSFAPMNAAAMDETYNTDENIYNFYKNLCASLDCRVISNVNDYIMDEGYFFDSEYHLNDSGVPVRTVQLIDDIKREKGITSVTVSRNDLPEPSGYAPIEIVGGDEVNEHFVMELVESNGQTVWKIIGLNDLGLTQKGLRIPNNVSGIPVVIIAPNAFAGSLLETLYLGENIRSIDPGAFGGASSLTSVYIPKSKTLSDASTTISVPNNMGPDGLATKGANPALKIYVPESALTVYKSDYFWGDYSKHLEGY